MTNFTSYWFNKSYVISGEENSFNLLWLAFFSIGIIFIGLGWRDPWPADEPRFAQIAREMVETNQWFFPTRGGELYPDKPPVFMWSIALFYSMTGSLSISFLLPSALSSLLTIFLIYDLGKRLWSIQVGWYASLILLLSLQFILQAKSAQIDAMVTSWITIGIYGLTRHLLLGNGWRWYFLGFFFMGIGIITKGVGFLPVFILIPYIIVRFSHKQANEIKGSVIWLLGILVLFAAILLWLIPMLYWVDQSQNILFEQYRDNILFKQTGERYARSWHHVKPFWYYFLEVIPLFWLPISLFLPWLIKNWLQSIKQGDRRIILLLGWIAALLIFFSFSPGKRGVYILPAVPILALISAPYIKQLLQLKWPKQLLWWLVALLSLLSFLVGSIGLIEIKASVKLVEKYQLNPWNYFLVIGITGLSISFFTRKKNKAFSWILAIPMGWILYSTWGYQLLNPIKTPRNVLQNIAAKITNDSELAMIGFREQFLLFSPFSFTHFGYHTEILSAQQAAWEWQVTNDKRYVLTYKAAKMPCFNMDYAISVGYAHRKHWLLLPANARLQKCQRTEKAAPIYHFSPQKII